MAKQVGGIANIGPGDIGFPPRKMHQTVLPLHCYLLPVSLPLLPGGEERALLGAPDPDVASIPLFALVGDGGRVVVREVQNLPGWEGESVC